MNEQEHALTVLTYEPDGKVRTLIFTDGTGHEYTIEELVRIIARTLQAERATVGLKAKEQP